MGTMVFSLGQGTSAEASFSSNTPTCNTEVKYDWSTNNKNIEFDSTTQKQLIEQINAQLAANGFKQTIDFKASQKAAAPAKKAATQPVEQKPAEAAKPAAKAPAAKPVAPTPAPIQTAKPAETQQPTAAPAADASISSIEQQVLTLTNQERAKEGLKPFSTDSALMDSARAKSSDMSNNNYFSHTSPTLGSPFDQMKAKGIQYKAAAENIAKGQRTAAEVVKDGWNHQVIEQIS